jgi:hypothetical protein
MVVPVGIENSTILRILSSQNAWKDSSVPPPVGGDAETAVKKRKKLQSTSPILNKLPTSFSSHLSGNIPEMKLLYMGSETEIFSESAKGSLRAPISAAMEGRVFLGRLGSEHLAINSAVINE